MRKNKLEADMEQVFKLAAQATQMASVASTPRRREALLAKLSTVRDDVVRLLALGLVVAEHTDALVSVTDWVLTLGEDRKMKAAARALYNTAPRGVRVAAAVARATRTTRKPPKTTKKTRAPRKVKL